jgi:hypothetical protein
MSELHRITIEPGKCGVDAKAAALSPQGVVAESWGVLAMPARQVRELLAQEGELLDG